MQYNEKMHKNQAQMDLEREEEEDESEIHISLCGHLIALENGEQKKTLRQMANIFEEHKILYEKFRENPH